MFPIFALQRLVCNNHKVPPTQDYTVELSVFQENTYSVQGVIIRKRLSNNLMANDYQ